MQAKEFQPECSCLSDLRRRFSLLPINRLGHAHSLVHAITSAKELIVRGRGLEPHGLRTVNPAFQLIVTELARAADRLDFAVVSYATDAWRSVEPLCCATLETAISARYILAGANPESRLIARLKHFLAKCRDGERAILPIELSPASARMLVKQLESQIGVASLGRTVIYHEKWPMLKWRFVRLGEEALFQTLYSRLSSLHRTETAGMFEVLVSDRKSASFLLKHPRREAHHEVCLARWVLYESGKQLLQAFRDLCRCFQIHTPLQRIDESVSALEGEIASLSSEAKA